MSGFEWCSECVSDTSLDTETQVVSTTAPPTCALFELAKAFSCDSIKLALRIENTRFHDISMSKGGRHIRWMTATRPRELEC